MKRLTNKNWHAFSQRQFLEILRKYIPIHSKPHASGWPNSNIFPKKFHSTTIHGRISSLSIQINGNYGWSRNNNALGAQVSAKVIVYFLGPMQKYGLILGFQLSWIYWHAGEQIQECVQCSVPFTHLCRTCFSPAVWHISCNFFPSCTTAHGTVVWLCTAIDIIDKAMLLNCNNEL